MWQTRFVFGWKFCQLLSQVSLWRPHGTPQALGKLKALRLQRGSSFGEVVKMQKTTCDKHLSYFRKLFEHLREKTSTYRVEQTVEQTVTSWNGICKQKAPHLH